MNLQNKITGKYTHTMSNYAVRYDRTISKRGNGI